MRKSISKEETNVNINADGSLHLSKDSFVTHFNNNIKVTFKWTFDILNRMTKKSIQFINTKNDKNVTL